MADSSSEERDQTESTDAGDNLSLGLSEDHFGELDDSSRPTSPSSGLPIDKKNIERAIRKYIKLIRLEDTDEQTRRKLIVKLCELRIRLNEMNEAIEETHFKGHRLSSKSSCNVLASGGQVTSNAQNSPTAAAWSFVDPVLSTVMSSASSIACDVCLKKQSILPLPILKMFHPNQMLSCDFCDFKIHRTCLAAAMVAAPSTAATDTASVSSNNQVKQEQELHVRPCPKGLFDQEEDEEEQEQQHLKQAVSIARATSVSLVTSTTENDLLDAVKASRALRDPNLLTSEKGSCDPLDDENNFHAHFTAEDSGTLETDQEDEQIATQLHEPDQPSQAYKSSQWHLSHKSGPGNCSTPLVQTARSAVIKYSKYVIFQVCPEVGLVKQGFKCADCSCPIRHSSGRLDDYDGRYYCHKCHWNDTESIPARIIHNWDSSPRPVSRRSLQLITFIKRKPVLFDVLSLNSMLYGLIEDLSLIKRLRIELSSMATYLRLCHQPNKPKLTIPFYLVESESKCNLFALNDLIYLEQLKKALIELHTCLFNHITVECQGCRGKGFYCDLCKDKSDLLFPFSANVSTCLECGFVYHRSCFHRKHKNCYKCHRRREKRLASPLSQDAAGEDGGRPGEEEQSEQTEESEERANSLGDEIKDASDEETCMQEQPLDT